MKNSFAEGRLKIRIAFVLSLLVASFFLFTQTVDAAIRTWDGDAADGLWSTDANWSSDLEPGTGDIATFSSGADAVSIDTAISVSGIDINSGYTGTISQNNSITVGTGNFDQADGTFSGSTQSIDMNGTFTLSSGTFTSTSGTMNVAGAWTHTTGGTFAHNNGTVVFDGASKAIDVATSETFYDFTLDKGFLNNLDVATGDTIIVTNTTTLIGGAINVGTLEVRGDMTVPSSMDSGSASIIARNSTAAQSFTFSNSSFPYSIEINKASGTVSLTTNLSITQPFTLTSGIFNLSGFDFTSSQTVTTAGGTFTGGTGTIDLGGPFIISGGTFTATSGTMMVAGDWTHTAGGTFAHNNGTVVFDGASKAIDVATSETFYDFTLNKSFLNNLNIASGDTLIVANDITLGYGALGNGTVEVQGNFTASANTDSSSTVIRFTGGNIQTFDITGSVSDFNGDIFVNKSGGQVNLASTLDMNQASQDLIIEEGTFDLNGNTLSVDGTSGTLIVETGGNLQMQGDEVITALSSYPQLDSGSTVTYDATSGSRAIKDYGYHHLTVNGSGGTFTMGVGEVLAGDLTVTAGTLDVSDQTLAINGNTTINGGTLKTGINTVTFGDAVGDNVTISSGGLEIESDNTSTDIVKNASTWTNSGGVIVYNGPTSTSTALLSSLSSYNNLTINSSSSTYTLDGAIDVNNALTIVAGALDASSGNNYGITVGGNWANSGTFTARLGTVTFDDVSKTSTISDSTTFYNLTSTTASKAITFTASTTQTISGTLTLTGGAGALITLRSSSTGTTWLLNISGSSSVDYVDAKDSDASSGNAIIHAVSAARSTDSGNNTNWSFNVAATVSSVTAVQGADGRVTITFEMDDADNDDTLEALVQYDVGGGFTKATLTTVDAETTADFGDPKVTNAETYQVGGATGYITSSSGSNTITTIWVASTDESAIDLSTAQIRVTPYDGIEVGVTSTSANFALDLTAPTVSSMAYKDIDADGTIDRLDLTFNEGVSIGECEAGDFTFAGSDAGSFAVSGCAISGNDVRLSLSGAPLSDTAVAITLAYSAASGVANSVTDSFNNSSLDIAATSVSDAAAPVVLSVAPTENKNTVSRTDDVAITFSEPMVPTFDYNTEFTSSPDPGGWSSVWSSSDSIVTLSHAPFLCVSTVTITTAEASIDAASGSSTTLLTTGPQDGDWSFTTVPCSSSGGGGSSSSSSSSSADESEVDNSEEEGTTDEIDADTGSDETMGGSTNTVFFPSQAMSPVTGALEEVHSVSAGDYIVGASYDTVYYITENYERRPFMDARTYFTWEDSFDDILSVSDATLTVLSLGAPMLPKPGVVLLKIQSDPRVYKVEIGETDTIQHLRWIPTEEIASALYGGSWSDYIIDIPPTLFSRFDFGEDVSGLEADSVDRVKMKLRDKLGG